MEREVLYRHATWGPEGEKLSPAEKERIMDEMLLKADMQMSDTVSVPREQLKSIYISLKRMVRLGQMDLSKFSIPDGELDLRRKIFQECEFPCLFAGQWLSKEDRGEIIEQFRKENE